MSAVQTILDVLESDLSSDAARLWVWLRLTGPSPMEAVLGASLPDVAPALRVLGLQGLTTVEGDLVTAHALPRGHTAAPAAEPGSRRPAGFVTSQQAIREALATPKKAESKAVITDGLETLVRLYDRARMKAGLRPAPSRSASTRKAWLTVLAVLAERDASFSDYLAFARENTRFAREKFPSPNLLASDFVVSKWRDREDGGLSPVGEHAGHTYGGAKPTRATLLGAGFTAAGGLTENQAKHLQDLADAARVQPVRRPHRDPEKEAMIQYLIALEATP